MNEPFPISRDDMKAMISETRAAERQLVHMPSDLPTLLISKNKEEDTVQKNKIYSCGEFLSTVFPSTQPLIGTENDALLVRGEGLFLPGQGGVGKTLFLDSIAASLAIGENIFRYRVLKPLRILIYQAELPPQFYQSRIKAMHDSYYLANPRAAKLIEENVFIADVKRPFDISANIESSFDAVIEEVDRLKIDVLIIDPFLSFFRGNENDNNEVRRALDNFKRCVAEEYQCGLIISDHMPKYAGSDKNPEQQYSMRGASAKRDWAATVVALSETKTPEGQHGSFIKATVDKMRYGKKPRDPFLLRRDDFSLRYEMIKIDADINLFDVAKLIDDAGGGLSKNNLTKAIKDAYPVSLHDARRLIEDAIERGMIVTEEGPRRSTIHNVGQKYIDQRDENQG